MFGGKEDCAEWQHDGDKWNNRRCSIRRSLLCRGICPTPALIQPPTLPTSNPTPSPTPVQPRAAIAGVGVFAAILFVAAGSVILAKERLEKDEKA